MARCQWKFSSWLANGHLLTVSSPGEWGEGGEGGEGERERGKKKEREREIPLVIRPVL